MGTHITVGVDGSAGSDAALRWAASEARSIGVALEIVHALDLPHTRGIYQRAMIEWGTTGELTRIGQDLVESAERRVAELAPGVDTWSRTETGSPLEVLANASRDAAAIIVGRRGSGSFDALPGSVGTRLAVHADCPVIVVPAPPGPATGPIVVGVDESALGRAALRYALHRAARSAATVRAVTAYELPVITIPLDPKLATQIEHDTHDAAAERLDEQIRAARTPETEDVPVESAVVEGRPADTICGQAHDARLIVVGSHGRGPIRRAFLGSVSHRLLHEATRAVVIVGGNRGRDTDA